MSEIPTYPPCEHGIPADCYCRACWPIPIAVEDESDAIAKAVYEWWRSEEGSGTMGGPKWDAFIAACERAWPRPAGRRTECPGCRNPDKMHNYGCPKFP